jgi:hypothetical protein
MSPVYIILSIYLYKPISISIYLLYIEYIYISKSENFSLFFFSFQSTQSLLCHIYDYNLVTSYIQEQLASSLKRRLFKI